MQSGPRACARPASKLSWTSGSASPCSPPRVVREHIRAGRLANDAEALARTFEHAGQHAMPARHQVLTALSALRLAGVPVLYLAGERDQKYRALADELADGGLCETRTIRGVGHNAHVEDPVGFARILGSVGAR